MSPTLHAVTFATALGCGLVAGVWFAFSAFVMPALDRLPADGAVAAMNSINRLAVTPPLMVAMFGAALGCLVLGIWGAFSWDRAAARWVLAGSALYLAGTIAVTAAGNVPLNDALATVPAQGVAAADRWPSYLRDWTAWNHVRGVTSLAAAALFTVALTVD